MHRRASSGTSRSLVPSGCSRAAPASLSAGNASSSIGYPLPDARAQPPLRQLGADLVIDTRRMGPARLRRRSRRTAPRGGERSAGQGRQHAAGAGDVAPGVSRSVLSLDRLDGVLEVHEDRREVTVEAGIRLCALNAALAERRLTLPVLGSIAEQSVAGAISTATHGSAPRLPNLAGLVTRLRMVFADGSVVD